MELVEGKVFVRDAALPLSCFVSCAYRRHQRRRSRLLCSQLNNGSQFKSIKQYSSSWICPPIVFLSPALRAGALPHALHHHLRPKPLRQHPPDHRQPRTDKEAKDMIQKSSNLIATAFKRNLAKSLTCIHHHTELYLS